jgi:hypothetical protein
LNRRKIDHVFSERGDKNIALPGWELTEEKVRKLKPIFESILSRKYGRNIKFIEFTFGNITCKEEQRSGENET